MKFLRTVSTRRLLMIIAGVVAAIAGTTAIAIAASSGGPVPPAKPLAQAIHQGLSAPPVKGISARITFTNKLIDSSNIVGSDPLLNGSRNGRIWISDQGVRLELQSDSGDAQVVAANGRFWVYDPGMNTAYEGALPKDSRSTTTTKPHSVPTIAQIEQQIGNVLQSANLNGVGAAPVPAVPGDVAHRPTYSVSISPKHDGGLLGSAQLAWDALRGVPLRLAVYAAGQSDPVLELKASHVSYGTIPASTFAVAPPRDAKVVKISAPAGGGAATSKHSRAGAQNGKKRSEKPQTVAQVQSQVPFTLSAPATLAGLPRHAVHAVQFGKEKGAVVTYGQNLGGVVVLEQPAGAHAGQIGSLTSGQGDRRTGLSLPTVSINGATGQELDTALGTMVRFTRAGVTYTVIGSVPPAAAEAAARGL